MSCCTKRAAGAFAPRALEQLLGQVHPRDVPAEGGELGCVPPRAARDVEQPAATDPAAPEQRVDEACLLRVRLVARRRRRSSARADPSYVFMQRTRARESCSTIVRDLFVGERRWTDGQVEPGLPQTSRRPGTARGRKPGWRCRNGCRFIGQKNVRESIAASASQARELVARERELIGDLDRVHPVDVSSPLELDGRLDARRRRRAETCTCARRAASAR